MVFADVPDVVWEVDGLRDTRKESREPRGARNKEQRTRNKDWFFLKLQCDASLFKACNSKLGIQNSEFSRIFEALN